jgi:glutamate N-acetyltransferase/amino-acid N-acetyltransferase
MKALHGTTLSLITTDAVLTPAFYKHFQEILDDSMNMVSVDGDQSTNDTCIMMANGLAGGKPADEDPNFLDAMRILTTKIARTIAMDGEGATKLITVEVKGAESKDDAKKVIKTIINSPLVKSAIFGSDPNYGRVMMAVGNSGAKFSLNDVHLTIKGGDMMVDILDSGAPVLQDETSVEAVRMTMDNKEVILQLDLGVGNASATGWRCDLTYDYVRINAEYAT